MNMKTVLFILVLPFAPGPVPAQQALPPPVIDMHLHPSAVDFAGPPPLAYCVPLTPYMPPLDPQEPWGVVFLRTFRAPPCPDPIWSPTTDQALIDETVAVLKRRNVIGVLAGPVESVRRWHAAAPDRFIAAADPDESGTPNPTSAPEALRPLFESEEFALLAELSYQYAGWAPDDERLEPYWAMAEELDIPVGIHMGEGPPGATGLFPEYRARLSSPYGLEDVLARHPRLRLYVMHYGSPMVSEMIAMMAAYPGLYVDIGGMATFYPRPYFYGQLKQFVDAGFGKRVMYGSDSMIWPGVIEAGIAVIEEAPVLTAAQKRDILYDNAARFLRLSEDDIARHHGKPSGVDP